MNRITTIVAALRNWNERALKRWATLRWGGLLVALLSVTAAQAQTYDQLWNEVSQAQDKDLPQTALKSIDRIRQKALSEGNGTWLLKALLAGRLAGLELADDSAATYVAHIMGLLDQPQSVAERALTHSALGCLIERSTNQPQVLPHLQGNRSAYLEEARRHFAASLTSAEQLAQTPLQTFLPLLAVDKEVEAARRNLLAVVYDAFLRARANQSAEVRRHGSHEVALAYERVGNRAAALRATIDSVTTDAETRPLSVGRRLADDSLFVALNQLTKQDAELKEQVLTYEAMVARYRTYDQAKPHDAENDSLILAKVAEGIQRYHTKKYNYCAGELMNFALELREPTASLGAMPKVYYPGATDTLTFRVRNAKSVVLEVIPLAKNAAGCDYSDSEVLDKLIAQQARKATTSRLPLKPCADYAWQELSFLFAAPKEPGIYAARLRMNGEVGAAEVFHVTAVRALVFAYAPNHNRVIVVDSQTGQPLAGAKVTAYTRQNARLLRTWLADDKGMVHITLDKNERYDRCYYASTLNDAASTEFSLQNSHYYGYQQNERQLTSIDVFTDRSIYRPGNKVDFSAIAYNKMGDDVRTVNGLEAEVKLLNANDKELDRLTLRTDSMGAIAGSFELPKSVLPGHFSIIITTGPRTARHYFRVEEYQRPTFTTSTDAITTIYQPGDTVMLTGHARTYTDLPIMGAKVRYAVKRNAWYRWTEETMPEQSGETTTDDAGAFTIPVALTLTERERQHRGFNRYFYTVSYHVTADNGETIDGETTLQTATRAGWWKTSWTDMQDKQHLQPIKATLLNASGEPIQARGYYQLLDATGLRAKGSFESGTPFEIDGLRTMPSGAYQLVLTTNLENVEADTLSCVLYSFDDVRPADKRSPFFTAERTNAANQSIDVLIGSPMNDVIIYYDLMAGDQLIESKRLVVSDSLLCFHLTYKPAYGDSATAYFAMVRNGQLYTSSTSVVKPLPQKQLNLEWATFRSSLTPGQKEEWRLRITHPDGTPASAQLLAALTDASLDAFGKNTWRISNVHFSRALPNARWNWPTFCNTWQQLTLRASIGAHFVQLPNIGTIQWDESLFYSPYTRLGGNFMGQTKLMKREAAAPRMLTKSVSNADYAMASNKEAAELDLAANKADAIAESSPTVATTTPRTNFNETAFFQPRLQADAKGEVSIAFTLPESMTTWNFSALAHDANMNFGLLDTTIVARKVFMVQPTMPRFVRQGDRVSIPVKVTSLAQEEMDVRLLFTIEDECDANQTLTKQQRSIHLLPNQPQVVHFTYEANDDSPLLSCKVIGEGGQFSDGESHYLPVLSSATSISRTLPFAMTERGTLKLDIDTLFDSEAPHRRLSVECASNPTWFAVTALPALAVNDRSKSAIAWATRYYALALGAEIARQNPAIKELAKDPQATNELTRLKLDNLDDLSPWLRQAQAEANRSEGLRELFDADASQANIYTTLAKLQALQQASGGWSWFPGMPANAYITTQVAILLARTQKLAGDKRINDLLMRSYQFLKAEMAQQVKQMKLTEARQKKELMPSSLQLDYLYLRTLLGDRPDADARFLLARAKQLQGELTMNGKAITALILAENGESTAAKGLLNSLIEHSVKTEQMGRYFDSYRANGAYGPSFRIPTQCAAIEALDYFGRKQEAAEMRLWLMQSKRTQLWETSRANTDAVYALLTANDSLVQRLDQTRPLFFTLYKDKQIVATNAANEAKAGQSVAYFKATFDEKPVIDATAIHLHHQSQGLTWGAVYADFTVPATAAKTEGNGLLVKRTFEVWRDQSWTELKPSNTLRPGDKVRQRFTITADRDYEFVQLDAARATCLNPTQPLSGYRWNDGIGAYTAVHDASTQFFIERLPKGTHFLTETYYVNRAGHYTTGLTRIACAYAPEFCGHTSDVTFDVLE